MLTTLKALLLSLLALFGSTAPAQAQDFPNKPVHLIVPAAPGGGDDFATRVLAEELSRILQQPFIVENKPGAGGLIGQTAVLKSPPDGYTLLLAGASMAGARFVNANATYDVLKDFTPISVIEQAPFVLVINSNLPVKDVSEFIAHTKAQAGKTTYGTIGQGQMPYWAVTLLNQRAGIQATEIQYKGVPEATVDVIAGRLDYLFLPLVSALTSKDKLKLLAVTTATRSDSAPDVPAMSEVLPGFDMPAWRSIMGPAGMPKSTVEILNKAIAQAIAAPQLRERYIKAGSTPMSGTPEQLHARYKDSIEIFGKIARDAGIKPQ
jgi:tripartite-type tricarboxylate transporter receptor subunit TctC